MKNALKEKRALWQVDVDVRRHHDQRQRDKDAQDRKAGEPLEPTPAAGQEPWWENPEEYTWSPEEDVPSPASVGSLPDPKADTAWVGESGRTWPDEANPDTGEPSARMTPFGIDCGLEGSSTLRARTYFAQPQL